MQVAHVFHRLNALLISSSVLAYKPDFSAFSRIINKKCVFLVYEFKPTKHNSEVESDLVKLGCQMRFSYKALVSHRVDNPIVCDVRSEGTQLTTYCMDMSSPNDNLTTQIKILFHRLLSRKEST